MDKMFGWKRHGGGSCPVPVGTTIKFLLRGELDGKHHYADASIEVTIDDGFGWAHSGSEMDIVGYKVLRNRYGDLVNADVAENPVSLFKQAVAEGWTAWTGGECPVDPDARVYYTMRDYPHEAGPDRAGDLRWVHLGTYSDITSYRVAVATAVPVIAADLLVPPLSGEDLIAGAPIKNTAPIPVLDDVVFLHSTITFEELAGFPYDDKPTQAGDPHEMLTFHELPAPVPTEDLGRCSNVVALPVRGATAADEKVYGAIADGYFESTEPGRAINPKDAIGSTKLPLHLWPAEATALGCLGMLEGELKYGRNNMVAGEGVIASIYIAAGMRHLLAWFEGEENAPDTGTPHLANALATIAIVVKCIAQKKLIDDRNYAPLPGGQLYREFVDGITPHVKRLQVLFADKNPRHYTIADTGLKVA